MPTKPRIPLNLATGIPLLPIGVAWIVSLSVMRWSVNRLLRVNYLS